MRASLGHGALEEPLGGLGIPSAFALCFDGVPIGSVASFGRHGSVVVVCMVSVSPHTHKLHAWLLTSFIPNAGHGGEAIANSLKAALVRPPLAMSVEELRAALAYVGGQGAVVAGGPGPKKKGNDGR